MGHNLNKTWIIADTNYFLHFQQPDQIDWSTIVSTKQIILVVPMIVIDELDKHKNASSSKLRTRAKTIITKLKDIRRSEEKLWGQNVVVEIAPNINLLDMTDLDDSRADDKILNFAISYSQMEDIDPSRVYLLSNDFGMELKAEGRGVQLLAISENLQIPAELDTSEKELRDLRKQNASFLNRMPKLSININETANRIEKHLSQIASLDEKEINSKIEKIKIQNPLHIDKPVVLDKPLIKEGFKQGYDLNKIVSAFSSIQNGPSPSKEQWENYNAELEDFYKKYQVFLRQDHSHQEQLSRSIFLDLYLENRGTTPATDVRVNLHFPDGFQLMKLSEFPAKPEKPLPPDEPKVTTIFDLISNANTFDSRFLHDLPILERNTEPSNVKDFSIKPTNSYEVKCSVRKAMHGEPIFLKSLVATFKSIEVANSFTVDYNLICDEFTETTTGQIHIIIKK